MFFKFKNKSHSSNLLNFAHKQKYLKKFVTRSCNVSY